MISYIRADPNSFSTSYIDLSKFEKVLISIDQNVMNNEIYKSCIEQNFEVLFNDLETNINVRSNSIFLNELLFSLKHFLDNAVTLTTTQNDLHERFDVVKSIALYGLYRQLLPANIPPDTKLFKSLWSVQKIVPFVVVYTNTVWHFSDLIILFSPYQDMKKLDPSNPALYKKSYLQQYDTNFSTRANVMLSQISAWIILVEEYMQPNFNLDASFIDQVNKTENLIHSILYHLFAI
jgi:hypothetical protein